MSIDLSKLSFPIPCPNCWFTNKIRIKDVQQTKMVICCGCHCKIKLEDKDATAKRKTKEAQNALNDLFDTVNRMNFKIKL